MAWEALEAIKEVTSSRKGPKVTPERAVQIAADKARKAKEHARRERLHTDLLLTGQVTLPRVVKGEKVLKQVNVSFVEQLQSVCMLLTKFSYSAEKVLELVPEFSSRVPANLTAELLTSVLENIKSSTRGYKNLNSDDVLKVCGFSNDSKTEAA